MNSAFISRPMMFWTEITKHCDTLFFVLSVTVLFGVMLMFFPIMHNAGQVRHIICQKSSGSLGSDLRFAISHRLLVTDEVD